MKKKTSNKVSINCDIRVAALKYWKGKDFYLPANKTYYLLIDYPFNEPTLFPFETKTGMGLVELLSLIAKAYDKKYQAAEKDDDDGYWHGIEDLAIEGINVNHATKKITLDVGS